MSEQIRTMTPPKFVAEHWPKHLDARDRELIEDFLDWVSESENGGAELRQYVSRSTETAVCKSWEEAPRPELLESFFAARGL